RRLFLVDVDPVRRSGISATNEQHEWAIERGWQGGKDLTEKISWPQPLVSDSGNGFHANFRIDLPNDDAAKDLLTPVVQALARFDDPRVTIDKTTFNAARVVKISGTMACKGENFPDKPWRLSRLLQVPEMNIVSREMLEKLAAEALRNDGKSNSDYRGN